MLRVSRLTDYAAAVMTCMAEHEGDVLSAMQIAEETGLELPTVSKLLKSLGHARRAADISLAEIVVALEGPIAMTECSLGSGQCGREARCTVRGSWQQISTILDDALRAVSLADMRRRSPPRRMAARPAAAVTR